MMIRKMLQRALFIFFFGLISLNASARQPGSMQDILGGEIGKTDKTYVTVGFALNEFRSVDVPIVELVPRANGDGFREETWEELSAAKTHPYGVMATLGTYITDYFKTDLRAGIGARSDTIDETLEVNLKYWASWYIGATYPVTDYLSASAMAGVTHYQTDVTRRQVVKYYADQPGLPEQPRNVIASLEEMEDDLLGTSFSLSWLVGFDYKLTSDFYLSFEYGRLLRDTDTNIKVYQANTSLRYEF